MPKTAINLKPSHACQKISGLADGTTTQYTFRLIICGIFVRFRPALHRDYKINFPRPDSNMS